ncbi:hypothetical protein O9993_11840 [Vibrio lentus]|nr:hypothetical protein [Vibrio lentus]
MTPEKQAILFDNTARNLGGGVPKKFNCATEVLLQSRSSLR